MQQICVWYYNIGTARVQVRVRLRPTLYFTYHCWNNRRKDSVLIPNVISVAPNGDVAKVISKNESSSNKFWHVVQVNYNEIF